MRVILHIGLPKTATTTIQHTMWAARKVLARRGLCYPGHFVRHHELARALELGAGGAAKWAAVAEGIVADFVQEARQSGARQMLVSSEALFDIRPASARLLSEIIGRQLPDAEGITVLAYVRDPIGFATSLGQQAIKTGRQRLSELYRNPYPVSVSRHLAGYAEVFGREAMTVRGFDPAHLKDGDVLADFQDAIGLGAAPLPLIAPVLNSSLSWEAVQIADALAGLRPRSGRLRKRRGAYKRLLEDIGGSPFVLPDEVQERVVEQSREDLAALRSQFGVDIPPRLRKADPAPPMPEATALSLARLIERLVEGPDNG